MNLLYIGIFSESYVFHPGCKGEVETSYYTGGR